MKKFFRDVFTVIGVIVLLVFFLVATPIALLLKWFFRIPYIFFRGLFEICMTFWKSMNEAYDSKKKQKKTEKEREWLAKHSKTIASTEKVN